MKKLITVLLVLISFTAMAQSAGADKILQTYSSEGEKGKVVISKQGEKYFGTVIWTYIPDARDSKNPDKTKRNNKIVGTVILKNFEYAGNNIWENGTIYDPESGNTYKGKMTLNSDETLSIRGFVGFSLFGRTTVWKKIKP